MLANSEMPRLPVPVTFEFARISRSPAKINSLTVPLLIRREVKGVPLKTPLLFAPLMVMTPLSELTTIVWAALGIVPGMGLMVGMAASGDRKRLGRHEVGHQHRPELEGHLLRAAVNDEGKGKAVKPLGLLAEVFVETLMVCETSTPSAVVPVNVTVPTPLKETW